MALIDLSTVPGNSDNFQSFMTELCGRLGVSHASYATVNPVTGAVLGYATYEAEWKALYTRRSYHHIDPTLHKAILSIAPVEWSRFEKDGHFRTVFNAASEFGITSQGLTVPIRGPYGDRGLLSVTSALPEAAWQTLRREIVGELQVAAVHLHDAVMRSSARMPALTRPVLSRREREVMQWVAAGKSQQDIGDILMISHRTVEVHLRSAREKLGALTTVQAVGRAIGMGVIEPR